MSSCSRRRRCQRLGDLGRALGAAENIDGVDKSHKEGAKFVALAREARGRVENGAVWGLAGDLQALGVPVDDDVKGLLTRVVAHHISERSQDARAMRYGKHDAT